MRARQSLVKAMKMEMDAARAEAEQSGAPASRVEFYLPPSPYISHAESVQAIREASGPTQQNLTDD